MNFKSLEVFYWVVNLNSFNKAAAKLHTTQPAVSQRIAALESDLGIRALDRTSRMVKPTAKGRVLYGYAERFMALHTEMMLKVAEEQAISGVIRLGVAETIVHTWLVEFLEQCRKRFPNVTIDFTVDITPTLRNELKSGELDMAFLLGSQQDAELVEAPLCSYELNFISAPFLKVGKEPLSNASIAAQPLITFPKRTYPYTYLSQELTTPDHGAPRIFTNWSLSTIVRMTEDGYGIGVVPPACRAEGTGAGAAQDTDDPDAAARPFFCGGLCAWKRRTHQGRAGRLGSGDRAQVDRRASAQVPTSVGAGDERGTRIRNIPEMKSLKSGGSRCFQREAIDE